MKIKIDPLDKLFAKVILLRDKYCRRCGGSGGLQTSHFHGRSKRSVRWDEDNAVLLCFGCHQYFHSQPQEHVEWFKQRLGEEKYNNLRGRMRQIGKPDKVLIGLYLKERIKELEKR